MNGKNQDGGSAVQSEPGVTARACAQLLLMTMPLVMRGIAAEARQQKHPDEPHPLAHFHVLRAIGCQPQTLREIAAHHHVTPSTMSRTIDLLVQKNWVTRQDNPRDRREVILGLTDEGRAAMAASIDHWREMVAMTLGRLDEAELARLYDGLRVLERLVPADDLAHSAL